MENEIQPQIGRSWAEKIFFSIFILLIIGSVGVTYWKIMVKRDYVITAQADCDPYEEKCFVHVCDPSPDMDGDWCVGDPIEDTWFTKNLSRMAYNIPDCDPADENCTALICAEGEADCSYELCDEDNVPEGDSCNDPEQYAKDNPMEEEEVDCDPETDEDCVIEESAECDSETEECDAVEEDTASVDENADVQVATQTCNETTGDVCPIGTNESASDPAPAE